MNASATRMGSTTLGYTAPRSVNLTPSQPDTFWGSVPPGVKTIVKVVVVAAVAYAALTLLLPGVAYTIGSVVAGVGSTVMSGVSATLAFFGISSAATVGAAAAAETASLGAGAAAVAAGAGTAAIMPAAKTATISASTLTSAPVISSPSAVPDISGSVAAIDPSQVALMKKSALASTAAMPVDPLHDHLADSHIHTDHGKMASKLGQEAIEIRDHDASKRHAASTRDHLSSIQNKVDQWTDRVGGTNGVSAKKPESAPVASHTESVQKRESAFATELNDERTRLEQAMGGPSV